MIVLYKFPGYEHFAQVRKYELHRDKFFPYCIFWSMGLTLVVCMNERFYRTSIADSI